MIVAFLTEEKMSYKYCAAAALAVACVSIQDDASGQSRMGISDRMQPVVVSSSGFAKVATNHITAESATCLGRSYTLRINREQKRIVLLRNETDELSDVSDTPFGKTFLTKSLYGKFFFNCPTEVGITFFGFEVQRSGPPKPVEYILIVKENGEILLDSGLLEESYETINRHLLLTPQ